jgi:hypothetical protein
MTVEPARTRSFRDFLALAIGPFLIGLCISIAVYVATGTSLGFYLGGIALLTLVLPALSTQRTSLVDSFIRAGAVFDGVAVGWIIGLASSTTVLQWLAAYAILAAYGLALWGITVALERAKFVATFAAAISTTAGLLWLTWPIWLATTLHSNAGPSLVRWVIPIHPLMAINKVMIDQGIWLQNRLIYPHVTLGQDVAYELPRSILPCVAFHLLVAAALVFAARPASSSAASTSVG